MFKEIKDVKTVCENMKARSDEIKGLASRLSDLMDKVKQRVDQEDSLNITLAIRKELSSLFILNSKIEDDLMALKKTFNSLSEINNKQ